MKSIILLFLIMTNIQAEVVYSVKPGEDYKKYSREELQKRVHWLEKAVEQLQKKVFNLSQAKVIEQKRKPEWRCRISVMGDDFTGEGESKAIASAKATENCKSQMKGTQFFCNVPKCSKY